MSNKLLIIFEGSKSSSFGDTPVTDMIRTRFPWINHRIYTFKPNFWNVRKARKILEANWWDEIVIIGKSFGAVKVKDLIQKTYFWCENKNIHIILIDAHSPLKFGRFKKTMKINTYLKIYNIYQRVIWPRGVKVLSRYVENYEVYSNHDAIIYNKTTMRILKEIF